jgi:hypothetical protein
MKNLSLSTFFFCLLLVGSTTQLLAQQTTCETHKIYQKQLETLQREGKFRTGFWVDQGYGASCTNNCVLNDHSPIACGSSATYKVPVKIWLFSDDGGVNQLVSASTAAQHLNYVNSYFACQGISISFYQITGSPQLIQSTDLNDFDNPSVAGDGDDAAVRATYYQNNVLNLYIPKALNGPGCNGYAYLPLNPGETNSSAVVMDGSCFQPVANVCTNTELAVVMIHEFGHFLGLYHTHNPRDLSSGAPVAAANECPDGSNACTAGDYIQDTDADPNYSDALITRVGCDITGIGVASPCVAPYSTTSNAENNIMSYNNSSGCRQIFSTCQKAKMIDCLFQTTDGGRNYLCDVDITRHFSSTAINNSNSPYQEICIGGTIPTFSAISVNCYNWYTVPTGGTPIATGTHIFTPSAAQVNVNVPGTYRFYAQELNDFSATCRTEVYVRVLSNAGVATPAMTNTLTGTSTLNLNSSGFGLASSGEALGWWVKPTAVAASDFGDQTALNTALSGATIGGTIGASPNNIYQATVGTPATGVGFSVNAAAVVGTYYATPFVSKVNPVVCTNTLSGYAGTTGGGVPAQFVYVPAGSISCRLATPATIAFTISITVSGYTGATNALAIFRKIGDCNGGYSGNIVSGNGTYTFTQANFTSGYDPNNGICFMLAQNPGGAGMQNATVTATITTTYTFNNLFPNVTLSSCSFGTPAAFSAAVLPIELTRFEGIQKKDRISLDWNTATERNNAFFSIYRSPDGLNFEPMQRVNGAGNSDVPQSYLAEDAKPFSGLNYYRLEQTDKDGQKQLVSTIVIPFERPQPLSIAPNPVTQNVFTLKYHSEEESSHAYFIYNNVGQLVQQGTLEAEEGNNQASIEVPNLGMGFYHFVLKDKGNEVKLINFVVSGL